MWNTATFASRVFAGWPSSPVPASRRTMGTPVPSGLQYIVSAGASASPGADRSHAAISRPACFAVRSARFAVAQPPACRPRLSAAFAKLFSDASSASARSAAGVSRTPARPATPSARSSGCAPAPFAHGHVQ